MRRKTYNYIQRSSSNICQKVSNISTIKQIHASMVINGFNSNSSAIRELIFASTMRVSEAIDYAHRVFDQIAEPDIFTWNTMIRGSAQSSNPLKAISVYSRMGKCNIKPDEFTLPFVLKACTRVSWVNMGLGIHARVIKFGFESNKFATNALIHFHANCGDLGIAKELFDEASKGDVVAWSSMTAGHAKRGRLDVARKLFDEMPVKDMVSFNVMITAYAKCGGMEQARELFDQLSQRDVVTWNAMISGYVMSGCQELALEMYDEMSSVGALADEVTMLQLLSACSDLGNLEMGEKMHRSIVEMGVKNLNILLENALIDMYAKCGRINQALQVFHGMRERDVSTWNSILVALAHHGHSDILLQLFAVMQRKKLGPNEITFVAVLVACSHAGKVQEGRQYFKLMTDTYNIEPNIKHIGCMVDMLGRAGLLNEAFDFVDEMKIEPNAIVWRTLLAACRVHGNVELGRRANEQLLRIRRDHSGDYVLLSNIYASAGEWNGAENVRNSMEDNGIRKESACSLIGAEEKTFKQFLFG